MCACVRACVCMCARAGLGCGGVVGWGVVRRSGSGARAAWGSSVAHWGAVLGGARLPDSKNTVALPPPLTPPAARTAPLSPWPAATTAPHPLLQRLAMCNNIGEASYVDSLVASAFLRTVKQLPSARAIARCISERYKIPLQGERASECAKRGCWWGSDASPLPYLASLARPSLHRCLVLKW